MKSKHTVAPNVGGVELEAGDFMWPAVPAAVALADDALAVVEVALLKHAARVKHVVAAGLPAEEVVHPGAGAADRVLAPVHLEPLLNALGRGGRRAQAEGCEDGGGGELHSKRYLG